MKTSFTKLSTSVLLTSLLLSGCGGESSNKKISLQQPHVKKITRELKDWTWNVETMVAKDSTFGIYFTTHYYDNIPEKIKHFQFFIDSDDDTKTGFTGLDGWEVFGADYLIEDDMLFKSLSDTEYKWEYIGKIAYRDNKKSGDERLISLQCPLSLAKEITANKVNIYIEPYDVNWVGEYYTIPLPNIKIETKDKSPIEGKATKAELDNLIDTWLSTTKAEDKLKIERLIENADVSEITDMSKLFYRPRHHTNTDVLKDLDLDLSKWDTSNVINMNYMFAGSKTAVPVNFNTSKVTNMSYMFSYSQLTTLPENFDTSNVTDMSYMFRFSQIKTLPQNFDTSKVTNMSYMFSTSELQSLPENFNTSNVTDMGSMFSASKIKTLPQNFDTSKVTNMNYMFSNSTITTLPENFNTSKVTNMNYMFSRSTIKTLPENFDTSKVTYMGRMFNYCENFNQDISNWNVSNAVHWLDFNKDSSLEDKNIPAKFK